MALTGSQPGREKNVAEKRMPEIATLHIMRQPLTGCLTVKKRKTCYRCPWTVRFSNKRYPRRSPEVFIVHPVENYAERGVHDSAQREKPEKYANACGNVKIVHNPHAAT